MPAYTPLDRAAERLAVPTEHLRAFQGFGWISIAEKNGTSFIRRDQEYRAKFILRMQQVLRLNPEEISAVLFAEEPPYSLAGATRILEDRATERRDG